MGKKNGKWVVAVIFAIVFVLAFISTRLKKDMMDRSQDTVGEAAVAE